MPSVLCLLSGGALRSSAPKNSSRPAWLHHNFLTCVCVCVGDGANPLLLPSLCPARPCLLKISLSLSLFAPGAHASGETHRYYSLNPKLTLHSLQGLTRQEQRAAAEESGGDEVGGLGGSESDASSQVYV